MKIFAAHNPDAAIRRESSSGGIFSMLAERILSGGGTVYGAAFEDDWSVAHRCVDRPGELWRLRGRKYVYSRIGRSIQHAASDLAAGRKVLFSGTPCQVAAARKQLGDNPLLLLVEVVCHGAPEARYWVRYLEELCTKQNHNVGDITQINFRDKCTGWKKYSMSIVFSDSTELSSFHGENPYFKAFLHNLTLRDGCFKCPFKYPLGSKADITLGDFWKLEIIAPDLAKDEGTSLVIARTQNGLEATNGINCIREFTYKEIIKCNSSLTTPAKRPKKYKRFKQETASTKDLIKLFDKWTSPSLSIIIKIRLKRILDTFKKLICE